MYIYIHTHWWFEDILLPLRLMLRLATSQVISSDNAQGFEGNGTLRWCCCSDALLPSIANHYYWNLEMKWNEGAEKDRTLNVPIHTQLRSASCWSLLRCRISHSISIPISWMKNLSIFLGYQCRDSRDWTKSSSRLIEQPMLCWYRSSREVLCVADYLQSHKFEILESEVANRFNRLFHKRIQDADD